MQRIRLNDRFRETMIQVLLQEYRRELELMTDDELVEFDQEMQRERKREQEFRLECELRLKETMCRSK